MAPGDATSPGTPLADPIDLTGRTALVTGGAMGIGLGICREQAAERGALGFTKNVALELALHDIAVNAIAPGGIETPGTGDVEGAQLEAFEAMIPMGRMGDPDDIARTALFLSSNLAATSPASRSWSTGGGCWPEQKAAGSAEMAKVASNPSLKVQPSCRMLPTALYIDPRNPVFGQRSSLQESTWFAPRSNRPI
jgi:Enoyl-(Acyl carrier protein) reductase